MRRHDASSLRVRDDASVPAVGEDDVATGIGVKGECKLGGPTRRTATTFGKLAAEDRPRFREVRSHNVDRVEDVARNRTSRCRIEYGENSCFAADPKRLIRRIDRNFQTDDESVR